MTESELWETIIKKSRAALEAIDGAEPSPRDVDIVAARTMMLFTPDCDNSREAAAPSISSSIAQTFSARLLAIAGVFRQRL